MAAAEPYRVGRRLSLIGPRHVTWFVYDMRTDERVRSFKSRDEAVTAADLLNKAPR